MREQCFQSQNFIFRFTAAEWRRGIPDRTVKVKLGPSKIIKVSSDRGQLLRTIDLRGMEWIVVFLQSDREQTLLSVRMDREYDMVRGIDLLLSKPILQARVCMSVFLTLISSSSENKSCMRVDKLEFMRFFSTPMSWSNENKSYMKVDES